MNENPYAPPKAALREAPEVRARPSAATRFLLTAGCAFPVYLFLVWMGPQGLTSAGLVGSLGIGLFAGVVALGIPVRSKLLFVIPAIVIAAVLTVVLASYNPRAQ